MKKEFDILHKNGKGLGVRLPDGTIIVADDNIKGVRIALLRTKWKKIFEVMQKDWKYYEFVLSKSEMDMLIKGLSYKAQKSTTPKKAGHNSRNNQSAKDKCEFVDNNNECTIKKMAREISLKYAD